MPEFGNPGFKGQRGKRIGLNSYGFTSGWNWSNQHRVLTTQQIDFLRSLEIGTSAILVKADR
jgi:hypothetical protein